MVTPYADPNADLGLGVAQAIDFLEKCLTFSPKRRIEVGDALQHPYLAVSFLVFLVLGCCFVGVMLGRGDDWAWRMAEEEDRVIECAVDGPISFSLPFHTTRSPFTLLIS